MAAPWFAPWFVQTEISATSSIVDTRQIRASRASSTASSSTRRRAAFTSIRHACGIRKTRRAPSAPFVTCATTASPARRCLGLIYSRRRVGYDVVVVPARATHRFGLLEILAFLGCGLPSSGWLSRPFVHAPAKRLRQTCPVMTSAPLEYDELSVGGAETGRALSPARRAPLSPQRACSRSPPRREPRVDFGFAAHRTWRHRDPVVPTPSRVLRPRPRGSRSSGVNASAAAAMGVRRVAQGLRRRREAHHRIAGPVGSSRDRHHHPRKELPHAQMTRAWRGGFPEPNEVR